MTNLSDATRERIASIIDSDRVVLFMKGTPQSPQCGFSATVVQILNRFVLSYTTFDALGDPEIREGIKAYSSWPTIPQLYVDGEFIGGCDIVQEMHTSGELQKTLSGETPASAD
jgi:monothiol glutaredoxin